MKRGFFVVLLLVASHAAADPGETGQALPLPPVPRPFLLTTAGRRFSPDEAASIAIQSTRDGEVEVALYRLRDGARALSLSGRRQGVSVAQSTLGDEAERLLASGERRSALLELTSRRRVHLATPRALRGIADESEVYDSNDALEEDVATWGVDQTGWAETIVPFGRLARGMYLARVHMGAFASTALLSVGDLVLVARRGDRSDFVLATDGRGRPQTGVVITARSHEGRDVRSAPTDRDGVARFEAVDSPVVRFEASTGEDIAITDVAHARLDPCDPRVYVALGQAFYRPSETMHVRGHVRGCDRSGGYGALGNEPVELLDAMGSPVATARTDRDGNFIAEVPATAELIARFRGREHARPVHIESRVAPRQALNIAIDRSSAVPGDVVQVRVEDDDGGWPSAASVVLTTPWGDQLAAIGPHRPATFAIAVPHVVDRTAPASFTASLTTGYATTLASASLMLGQDDTLLEVLPEASHASADSRQEITIRGESLTGDAIEGTVTVAVCSTDGNERGGEKWRGTARMTRGSAALSVALEGAGPWWIEARKGSAVAHGIVWDRDRPTAIGRGQLAIEPVEGRVLPGARLTAALHAPPGGHVLVTLEQSGVLAAQLVSSNTRSVTFDVPADTTGRGALVATHIDRGAVRIATATIEIATSRDVEVSVSTERTTYDEGERVHVAIESRTEGGQPTSGVATLWFADAGYWDMGEDEYPMPGAYLARPGRMASPGDSTRPMGFGAEEGRVLRDATMTWNGERVSGATYRHGWAHVGELVTFDARVTMLEIARTLAREAGLSDAELCLDIGPIADADVHVRDLPWDLVAVKIAERIERSAWVRDGRTLVFDCSARGVTGFGSGGGSGSGYGLGAASMVRPHEARMLGTLAFIGLARLDAHGRFETDLEMPRLPGRYRIEALVIADDGGGDRAHRVLHVERPLVAFLEAPPVLRAGDVGSAELAIESAAHANEQVSVALDTEGTIAIEQASLDVRLDGRGRANVRIPLRSTGDGAGTLFARTTAGSDVDAVRLAIETRAAGVLEPIELVANVGPEATTVHLALPDAVRGGPLAIALDGSIPDELETLVERLARERTGFGAAYVERRAAIATLFDVLDRLPETAQKARIQDAMSRLARGDQAALDALETDTGAHAFWGPLGDDPFVSARAANAMDGDEDLLAALERRAAQPLEPRVAAEVALALAGSYTTEDTARSLLATIRPRDEDAASWASLALAARKLEDPSQLAIVEHLERALRVIVERREPAPRACVGAGWYACFVWVGEAAELAHAARVWIEVGGPGARALAAQVAVHVTRQPMMRGWAHGADEAEMLALRAALGPRRGRDPIVAEIDGVRVAITEGAVAIPDDAHALTLRFAAREGRFRTVSILGEVALEAVTAPLGDVRVRRSIERREGGYVLAIAIESSGALTDVALRVPLPSGLGVHPLARLGATDRIASLDDGLALAFDRLGAHARFELPLVRFAAGDYAMPPALLRAEGGHFGIAPDARITVE